MPNRGPDTRTPVVFLHAFPLDATLWDAERAKLDDRTTLAPNFTGFGGETPRGNTLDDFSEGVVAAMDAADIRRAIVVGLSMGGYVAFRLYSRCPERVAALVLADTRAGADSAEAAQKRTDQAARARVDGIEWLADAVIPGLLGETTRANRPEVVGRIREIIDRSDPEGVARALEAMRERPDSTPMLEQIDVPVLVIVGEEDTLTPVDEAMRIANAVPGAVLRTIPGAGHLSNLENPHAFQEAIEEFVRAMDDGTSRTDAS